MLGLNPLSSTSLSELIFVPTFTSSLTGVASFNASGIVRGINLGSPYNIGGVEGISPTGTLATVYTPAGGASQSVSGAFTPAGALLKSVSTARTGSSSTITGAVLKSVNTTKTGSFSSPVGALLLQVAKLVTGSLTTPTGALLRIVNTLLLGSLSKSGTLLKSVSISKIGSLSPIGAVLKLYTFVTTKLVGSLSYSGTVTLLTSFLKTITGSLSNSGALTTLKIFLKTLTGDLSNSATLLRAISVSKVGSLSDSGALLRSTSRALLGSLSDSGTLLGRANKVLVGALSKSGALASLKVANAILSGALTHSGALVGRANKVLVGSLDNSGTLLKSISRALLGSLSKSGALLKVRFTTLVGSLSFSGAISSGAGSLQSVITGALSSSGIVAGKVNKAFTGSLSTSGSIVRRINVFKLGNLTLGAISAIRGFNFQGAISFSSTLLGVRTLSTQFLSLASQLSYSGIVIKTTIYHIVGIISGSGVVTKVNQLSKGLTGVLSIPGVVIKSLRKFIVAGLSLSGSLPSSGLVSQVLTSALSYVGVLNTKKQYNKVLTATLSTSGTVLKLVYKYYIGNISPSASGLLRGTNTQGAMSLSSSIISDLPSLFRVSTGSITPVGDLLKRTIKSFTGSISPTSPLRLVSRFNVGIISLSGTLTNKRVVPITVSGSLSGSGSVVKIYVRILSGSFSPGSIVLKVPSKIISGVFNPQGVTSTGTANFRSLTSTLGLVGSLTVIRGSFSFISVSGTLSHVGNITRTWTKFISGSLSPTSTLGRRITALKFSTLAPAGSLSVSNLGLSKFLTGSLSNSGIVLKRSESVLLGTLSLVGTVVPVIGVTVVLLTGILTSSGILSTIRVRLLSLIGSLTTITGVVRKRVNLVVTKIVGSITPTSVGVIGGRNYQGALSFTGSIVAGKITVKSGSVTSVGSLTLLKVLGKSLSGVLTLGAVSSGRSRFNTGVFSLTSGTVVAIKVRKTSIVGSTVSSGLISRRVNKLTTGSLSGSSTILRRISKFILGSFSPAGDLVHSGAAGLSKSIDGLLSLTGVVLRKITKLVGCDFIPLHLTPSVSKIPTKLLLGGLSTTGILVYSNILKKHSVSGSLSTSTILVKTTINTLVGVIYIINIVDYIGDITKRLIRPFIGSFNSIGFLSSVRVIINNLSINSITLIGNIIVKKVSLFSLASSTTFSGILSRQLGRVLLGSIITSGILVASKTSKTATLSGTVSSSGIIRKVSNLSPNGVILLSSNIIKLVLSNLFAGLLVVAVTIVQKANILNSVVGSSSYQGQLVKYGFKLVSGVLNSSSTLRLTIYKVIQGSFTPLGSNVSRSTNVSSSVLSYSSTLDTTFISLPSSSSVILTSFNFSTSTIVDVIGSTSTISDPIYNTPTISDFTWS